MYSVSNLLDSLNVNTISKWCKQFNHAVVDEVYLTILVIYCNKFLRLPVYFVRAASAIEEMYTNTDSMFTEYLHIKLKKHMVMWKSW